MTGYYSTAAAAITMTVFAASSSSGTFAFTAPSVAGSHLTRGDGTTSSSSLFLAMNKRNKFNKQQELAAKMEEAKRLRELAETGGDGGAAASTTDNTSNDATSSSEQLSDKEIKLRNDRQRFADMLENSMTSSNGELGDGYYLTVEQENENADAVFRGITTAIMDCVDLADRHIDPHNFSFLADSQHSTQKSARKWTQKEEKNGTTL